ncbi:putative calcium-binding protein CML23 isoform X1 [Pomacea canaliculata]|uniref:putative calcium-binding protein CML23 isoform X1 n=1 Tax=Pomacea canaliculata TaxID=400727 RepID=UPI000D735F72|nr:putative calcium-binding protein CML23 isoform X1 [Pomacea canaliculata]
MLSYWILISLTTLCFSSHLPGGPHAHIFNKVFSLFDQDGDNKVNVTEFWATVPNADLNGDGIITEEEFIETWESITQYTSEEEEENRHSAELLFKQVTNTTLSVNDKILLFKVFDTNNDGVISRREFLIEWERIHPEHDDYTSEPHSPMPTSPVR